MRVKEITRDERVEVRERRRTFRERCVELGELGK